MKRSTVIAGERMKAAKIPCWIETHRRMKWRLAMRVPFAQKVLHAVRFFLSN